MPMFGFVDPNRDLVSDFREDADHGGARRPACVDRWSVRRSWCRWRKSPTTRSAARARVSFVVYGAIIVLIARFQPGGI
jgi:hypothetical protein